MSERRFYQAVVAASDAVAVVEPSLAKVMPLPASPIRTAGAGGLAPDELLKSRSGLRNVSVAAVMEFDLRDRMRCRMTAPRALDAGPARRQAIFNGPIQYIAEQTDAAIAFSTSFTLVVQTRIE